MGNKSEISWQRPAKTEEWAYEHYCSLNSTSPFIDYVGFPWATLIDLRRKAQNERADSLERNLIAFGPKSTLVRATVCQHIWAPDMLDHFKALKITDLFWSHATRAEPYMGAIRVHPFPLFPVVFSDRVGSPTPTTLLVKSRRFLYNFVGAYDPRIYLSRVRRWIFELPKRIDAMVIERQSWHFENDVYNDQVHGRSVSLSEKAQSAQNADVYRNILVDSHFTLCPSGSGPNSIRLWESLGAGSIPVLISDSLKLPGEEAEWEMAIVRVPEREVDIQRLPELLEKMLRNADEMKVRQAAGAALWERYIVNGPANLLEALGDHDVLQQLTARDRSG